MKRIFTAAALAAAVCFSSDAQTGVSDVYPAHQGREITMSDIFIDHSVSPKTRRYYWNEDGTVARAGQNVVRRKNVFFRKGGSLFFLESKDTVAIARSEGDGIVCGGSVSRNEFGIGKGIFPSPDTSMVAFYRKDERAVSKFPLLDIRTRTVSLKEIRYPMNGMASEHISVGIWHRASRRTVYVSCNDFDDERYLTNISWAPDGKYVFIQVLDRPQHEMHLNMYRSSDGTFVRTLLTEKNDAWVEPEDPVRFMEGTYQFIYRTDNRDAYKSLYLCDTLGGIRRITEAAADVSYVANDGRYLYYCSAEVSPTENHLFRIELKQKRSHALKDVRIGKPQRLTFERGWHSVSLSPDGTKFIDNWSSFNLPYAAAVRTVKGEMVEELFTAPDPLAGFGVGEIDFGTVPSADGKYMNAYRLLKPKDFDPSKKYPLILYVYGGPHSQLVKDSWLAEVRMWEVLMASRGYIVYVQDNRGTRNRGAEYEKAINRRCGQVEMEDQMVGIRMLTEQGWVDRDRIGVHGWSYGGFMTISLMTNYPDVFKVGVAGGPVIDWKWYEVMYGERYMDTPGTNPEGFRQTSLIEKAGDLKGKLLICQGAVDGTVVWQHSLSFIQKCIENDIQVDYFPYPLSEHNVTGAWRKHLHDKITAYFEDYL